jgi:polysaccharide export outer membrane protein
MFKLMPDPKIFGLCAILVFGLTAGAQTTATPTPAAIAADPNPLLNLPMQRVGPEDLLKLDVYDAPEMSRTVRVDEKGNIRLPMLKDLIRVQGLLPTEIETLVAEALQREKLFNDPYVTVNVAEYHSRPISVTGAVKTPTIFQAIGTVKLLDAIARAGGLDSANAGFEIVVSRPNGTTNTQSVQRIPVKALMNGTDPELNIVLQGGEEIRVPEVGHIVVAGSVTQPGVYNVLDSGGTTVQTSIAQAKGLVPYAAHKAFIYRPDEQGVQHEIPVNLWAILQRKSPDVQLQAKDVLYVPDSSGRRITQETINALTQLGTTATAGILIYRK